MKQKHKKKINPFAERLQPGEEILWFESHPKGPVAITDALSVGAIFLIAFGFACAIPSAIPVGTQTVPTAYQIESFLQIVLRLGGPLTFLLALMLLGHIASRSSENNYAITTRRVLFDGTRGFRDLYITEIKKVQIHRISDDYISVQFNFIGPRPNIVHGGWQSNDWWWTWLKDEDAENILETISSASRIPDCGRGQGAQA